MSGAATFRLVQGFYYLALGTWFGALVMLAIAAAVTFRTVRELQPTINAPPYNQPALVDRAPAIVAGSIVGNVLKALAVVQAVCALVAAGCVVLQCSVFAGQIRGGASSWVNLLRVALVALPVVILIVDVTVVTPRIWSVRAVMFDADRPSRDREAARVTFDRLHKLDERIVSASVFMLVAAAFVSAFTFEIGPQAWPQRNPPEVRSVSPLPSGSGPGASTPAS